MFSVVKAFAIAVTALFLIAPTLASADCDDANETDCAPVCVCVRTCHTVAALPARGPATSLATLDTWRLCFAVDTFIGDLLPADIFRPPVAS